MHDIRKLPDFDLEVSRAVDLIEGTCIEIHYGKCMEDIKIAYDRKSADEIIKKMINDLYEKLKWEKK